MIRSLHSIYIYVQGNAVDVYYSDLLGKHEYEGADTNIHLHRSHASKLPKLPTHFFLPRVLWEHLHGDPLLSALPYFPAQYNLHTVSNQI
jgi:hypothetical protein